MADDFAERVREEAEERVDRRFWDRLRERTNDAVERLGLSGGALPERRE